MLLHKMSVITNGVHHSTNDKFLPPNPHLKNLKTDFLYHLGFSKDTDDLKTLFGDVKFVCCGGSARRMEKLANYLVNELNIGLPYGSQLTNLCTTDRYAMYKVGPVLCVSHGMGVPSMSIMLHEMIKLISYAECGKGVTFFRLGTSGGIGVEPGTVVVANGAVNGLLEPEYECFAIGKRVTYPSICDIKLSNAIFEASKKVDFPVIQGKTMCTDDFYEGQGRLDGALCSYDEADKMEFLNKARALGVRNIEMESSAFFALTHRAGYKAAIVCVTLLNRLLGDQVSKDVPKLKSYEDRPCKLVSCYIKQQMSN